MTLQVICNRCPNYLLQHLFAVHSIIIRVFTLPVCIISMSTVFSSGHSNKEDRVSRASRKRCEDNRMCPGSAVEGRRIQGSYCTLWNGLRNVRCLPFFSLSLGLGRITCCRRRALKITGTRDACVQHRAGTRMFAVTHLHILLWRPAGVHRRKRAPPSLSRYAGHGRELDGKPVT